MLPLVHHKEQAVLGQVSQKLTPRQELKSKWFIKVFSGRNWWGSGRSKTRKERKPSKGTVLSQVGRIISAWSHRKALAYKLSSRVFLMRWGRSSYFCTSHGLAKTLCENISLQEFLDGSTGSRAIFWKELKVPTITNKTWRRWGRTAEVVGGITEALGRALTQRGRMVVHLPLKASRQSPSCVPSVSHRLFLELFLSVYAL